MRNDGAEVRADHAQVRKWHQEYLQDSTSDKPDVMIFAHGHFGRVLIARWLGYPLAHGRSSANERTRLTPLGREAFQSWNCIGMCAAVITADWLNETKVSVLGYRRDVGETVLDVLNVQF